MSQSKDSSGAEGKAKPKSERKRPAAGPKPPVEPVAVAGPSVPEDLAPFIDKVEAANSKLAKVKRAERIAVEMREGKPMYRWVSTTPTRTLTDEEVKQWVG